MTKILVVDDCYFVQEAIKRAISKSAVEAQPEPLNDGLSLPPVEEIDMRVYFKAASEIFGSPFRAEKWLDENSDRLSGKTRRGNKQRMKEAKKEIYSLLGKQR